MRPVKKAGAAGDRVYTGHDSECQMEIPINRFQFITGHEERRSRRDFLHLAGAVAAGSTFANSQVKAEAPDSPQIGILLGTTFTTGTLEERLDGAKACGLACVQL